MYRSKTTPRPHQEEEFDKHRDSPARALFWSMRSGKSKAMIDLAEYLYNTGEVTGVLVFAPNGVHDNWIRRELPIHCSTPWIGHAWNSSSRKTKQHANAVHRLLTGKPGHLSVFSINSETVWREHAKLEVINFLNAHKGRILFVVDESHDFRSPSSKRTGMAKAVAKKCTHKRILSGTSASNSPLALWSQFEILEPGALGFPTFGSFKANYAIVKMARTKGGRQFEQIVGYREQDDLQQRVSKWASVILKKDAGIPAILDGSFEFAMTEKQRKLYDKVSNELMLEDQVLEGGALLGKLQQISRGWYYKEDGTPELVVKHSDNPALQGLLRLISEAEGKVIVWARHREELDQISDILKTEGIKHVAYRGGMNPAQKLKARTSFTDDPSIKVFVGQPKAGGVGLDLSVAELIVWYSHVFDLIDYEQATERASAAWKEKGVDVIHMMAHNTVDGYIRDAHSRKADIASEVSGEGLKRLLEALEIV